MSKKIFITPKSSLFKKNVAILSRCMGYPIFHYGNFNPSRADPGGREQNNLIFIFTLLCSGSNSFMKPFEAPQRIVKGKIQISRKKKNAISRNFEIRHFVK